MFAMNNLHITRLEASLRKIGALLAVNVTNGRDSSIEFIIVIMIYRTVAWRSYDPKQLRRRKVARDIFMTHF